VLPPENDERLLLPDERVLPPEYEERLELPDDREDPLNDELELLDEPLYELLDEEPEETLLRLELERETDDEPLL